MPYVKILLTESVYGNDGDIDVLRNNITDWEQVTDEELELLQRYLSTTYPQLSSNFRPTLIVRDDIPIKGRIQTIRQVVEKLKKDNEAREIKAQQTKNANKLKRLAKTAAEEKALLKDLLVKHGPKNVEIAID